MTTYIFIFQNLKTISFSFIGVHYGQTKNPEIQNQKMDEACYEKCMRFLREDHQVLIFVHSRTATIKLVKMFGEKSASNVKFLLKRKDFLE